MPFSYRRRKLAGESAWSRAAHAFVRAVILVLLGVFLATRTGEPTTWIFTNVLAQIGLGYFFVYLLSGFRWPVQATACVLILGGYWYFMQIGYWQWTGRPQPTAEYDYAAVGVKPQEGEVLTGRFAPWSKNHNAAHEVDLVLLNALSDPGGVAQEQWRAKAAAGELTFGERFQYGVRRIFFSNTHEFRFNSGGYQTLNFIPSMATMLMGVMCGSLLIGPFAPGRKVLLLLIAAIACLLLGRIAGIYFCPIVKRIWTPSWALFSGGYVIALLAVFFLLFDLLPLRRLAFPLVVVGMNSMVMYMMGQLMGGFARERIVRPHLTGLMETALGTDPVRDGPRYLLADDMFGRLAEPWAVLVVFWLIVYWLYRQKVFMRV
jgi:predicted acyltransferase